MNVIEIAHKKIKQKNNIFLKLLFDILIQEFDRLKLIKQLDNFTIKHSTDCLKNKNSLSCSCPHEEVLSRNFVEINETI